MSDSKDIDFKNKEDYQKWLAYGHMHGVFHGHTPVSIHGSEHSVKHGDSTPRNGNASRDGAWSGADAILKNTIVK